MGWFSPYEVGIGLNKEAQWPFLLEIFIFAFKYIELNSVASNYILYLAKK